MSIKRIVLAVFVLSNLIAQAQNLSLKWRYANGRTQNDMCRALCTDHQGNTISSSIFNDSLIYSTPLGIDTIVEVGGHDFVIQKNDSLGNLIWLKHIGGTGTEYVESIVTDNVGNIYIYGEFWGTIDFDPSAASFNLTQTKFENNFIAKYDSNGDLIWAKKMELFKYGNIGEMMMVNNALILMGGYNDSIDLDPSPAIDMRISNGDYDVFVVSLDTSGSVNWARDFGSSGQEWVKDISTDKDNNIYVCGDFSGTVDFDPGSGVYNVSSNGNRDGFILKISESGIFKKVITFGSASKEYANEIEIGENYDIYLQARYFDSIDVAPGPLEYKFGNPGNYGVCVVKLDSAGNLKWANSIDAFMSYGLQLGANEDVYTTGSFNGTIDLNPGPDTLLAYSSTLTSYLLKLDSASNFKWAQTNGPYFRYNVYDIEANGNNLKVYGSINTFIDFDFSIDTNYYSTKGGSDYFISEYKDSPAIYTVDSVEACNQHKWIDGTTYTTDQDSTWIRLLNAQGGDSIVFLNLVLDTVHAAISKNNV
ncbi:MAG: hypothetical protein N4A46_06710, partial [Schleiferiaceae bacterium]|nr:hypothetical protein [Schleiferiaceae bacterium]